MSQLLADLLTREGIRDERVLTAIASVQRYHFVTDNLTEVADVDQALPIGYEQTISQPYVVARMMELLLNDFDPQRVLEIGTGSGYQAALLAELVPQVYSVERIKPLHLKAKQKLAELGYKNIHLNYSDGINGWVEYSPYDAIMVTSGTAKVPTDLLAQLSSGGRIVIPLADSFLNQRLCVIYKDDKGSVRKELFDAVMFVPLLPGTRKNL